MNGTPQESNQLLEAFLSKGHQLAKKWAGIPGKALRGYNRGHKIDFLHGIDDPEKRALLAHLLENTHRWINGLDESTRTLQVGSLANVA